MARTKPTRNTPAPEYDAPSRFAQTDWNKTFNDVLIYLLAACGFYLGFSTLHALALRVGYSQHEAIAVASIADLAIFAYSRKALQEVKAGRSAWGIRLIVGVFSIATFALQLRSAWPNPTSLAFHAMPSAVWVIGHEMMLRGNLRDARKALRTLEIATGLRPAPLPRIRRVHWLLDPYHTLIVWRRMKLWELPQHIVVRQLAEDLAKDKKKSVPAAWQGILLTPVPLTALAATTEPQETQEAPAEPKVRDEAADMRERFMKTLPPAPPKGPNGRTSDESFAYISRVEQLAGEFGIECTDKWIASLLDVDPSRIVRIRAKQEMADASN